jgi:2-dehydro-3-deoxyglucarate aldolase/4-hydroxy-2-oxoheptanedioate aldolase
MMHPTFRQRLRAGETLVGTMVTEIKSPLLLPLLARCGFDYVIVDFEHGAFAAADLVQFVVTAGEGGVAVLVRPPGLRYEAIAPLWDAGAHGVMLPRVVTPAEVHELIRLSKYPPAGERGFGARGVVTGYVSESMSDRITHLNARGTLIIQVEKKEAVECIDALLEPEWVDAVIIGPADLSISLGIPGQTRHPVFVEAVERVLSACAARGIACGFHSRNLEEVLAWRDRGMRLVIYSTPFNLLQDAAIAAVDVFRGR